MKSIGAMAILGCNLVFCIFGCGAVGKRLIEYQDGNGNQYKVQIQNDLIIDSSIVRDENGSVIDIRKWTHRRGNLPADSLVFADNHDTGYQKCLDTLGNPNPTKGRTTKEILEYVKAETPKLREPYRKRKSNFIGKLFVKIQIRPNGTIKRIFLVSETTHQNDFAKSVLELIGKWKFPAVASCVDDVVTIPFLFDYRGSKK